MSPSWKESESISIRKHKGQLVRPTIIKRSLFTFAFLFAPRKDFLCFCVSASESGGRTANEFSSGK